ncbi:hypothetical protein T4A_12106 [Trichinella pseudospiralis]|uniref:Uncharacterized protein n=1 Tax=Trichinella pseudospiralis TaxID=6337 RepID=A0A0V1DZ73_TRIPS|nr:hypothetical protein T4A_12106 [Trichinella pseudospiralis]
MYLIFTISDSTRKRVLALLLLALCNSCLVVHGVVQRGGLQERFLSQLQLMEHANTGPASAHEKGPTEEFIRPRDRQRHFHEQPANLKVSQGQAKACCEDTPSSATIVRGTCSGSARSNHESGLLLPVIAATAHEKGPFKELVCPVDGQILCTAVHSEVNALMKQSPKDKRRPVAKTSLTPLRYYGGTCSRSAHSNHESKTNPPYKCTEKGTEKDSTARGRMQADLLLQTIPSTAYEEGASEKAVHHGNREILRPAALLC